MADKTLGKTVQKLTKMGEKIAPIKSFKVKVKFQKPKTKKRSAKNINSTQDKNNPLANRKAKKRGLGNPGGRMNQGMMQQSPSAMIGARNSKLGSQFGKSTAKLGRAMRGSKY